MITSLEAARCSLGPHVGLHCRRQPTCCVPSQTSLPAEVAFVITFGLKREGGLVPVVMFFVFVAVVCVFILALGYGLSSSEERITSRRCRMPYVMQRKRLVRRQRVRCRFEI